MSGRPSDLTKIVAQVPVRGPDGEIVSMRDVTTQDRIVELIRAGNYAETAAATVGIAKSTLYAWLRDGARAQRKVLATADRKARDRYRPTAYERQAIEFSDAVSEALSLSEADDVTRAARLAQGGHVVETIVEKQNAAGETIERTITRKVMPPDPNVITWRLERRFPARYGRRGSLDVTSVNVDGSNIDTDVLLAKLRAAKEAHAADLGEIPADVEHEGANETLPVE